MMGRLLLFLAVAALFLLRASDTLTADHSSGDQRAYVGVAMKLAHVGFSGYNLHHLERAFSRNGVTYELVPERQGELLTAYLDEGSGSYDQPLFHAPPLFAYLLQLSHRVAAPDARFFVLFPEAASRLSLRARIRAQLYVVAVPLLSGLLLAIVTFAIARSLFGYWTGLLAMALIAMSPAVLVASERIWADTLLAALVAGSFLFFLRHLQTRDARFLIAASIAFAGALLTKNTAILVAPALGISALHYCWEETRRLGPTLRQATVRLGGLLLLSGIIAFPWHYTVYQTWGVPMFDPIEPGASPWFAFVQMRPWYTYLVSIPAMVPLYLFGFYRIAVVLGRRIPTVERVLAVWFSSFLLVLMAIIARADVLGPDARYMLPAYPPLAILAAVQLLRAGEWLAARRSAQAAQLALLTAVVLGAAWAYRLSAPAYGQQMYTNFMHMPW